MKRFLAVLSGIFFSFSIAAQPYISAKTRHRFAQLNLGADIVYYSGAGSKATRINNNQSSTCELNPELENRLIIGGTHFWGHSDFFIAIPITSFGKSGFRASVETAARYYPWRIESGKLRPFIGAGWMPVLYKQGEGVDEFQHRFPLSGGVTYCKENHMFSLNAGYIPSNKLNYYISEQLIAATQLHRFSLALSYKFMIETTISSEKNWQNGYSKRLTDTLSQLRKLDGFTVGIGPSSSFYLKSSGHNKSFPYLKNHKAANIFPELALGYYFNKPDIQVNLAYRKMKSRLEAYGREQSAARSSLCLELYKFSGDYHGFVPFFGVVLAYEQLSLNDKNPDGSKDYYSDTQLKPGLVFGWDIRPDRLQSFYLRTNIRWTAGLSLQTTSGRSFSFDQLEVNFIELVLFPERIL